jgi:hypothetical protein
MDILLSARTLLFECKSDDPSSAHQPLAAGNRHLNSFKRGLQRKDSLPLLRGGETLGNLDDASRSEE